MRARCDVSCMLTVSRRVSAPVKHETLDVAPIGMMVSLYYYLQIR